MTNPTPLNPAVQAVLDATDEWASYDIPTGLIAAAALRAAAATTAEIDIPFAIIDEWEQIEGVCASFHAAAEWGYKQALADLLAIAAELEGAQ